MSQDKLFTLEQVNQLIQVAKEASVIGTTVFIERKCKEYIQSLTKQEFDCELEMEEKCCGLLKSTIKNSELTETCNYCSIRGNWLPEIVNNSVKVIKLIK